MSDDGSSIRRQWPLYAIVVAVYLFWGGNFVLSKFALREMPSGLVAGMRTVIAAAALMGVYWGWRNEDRPPLRRDEYPRICLIGLFGIGLNQVCFLTGLSLTSASRFLPAPKRLWAPGPAPAYSP